MSYKTVPHYKLSGHAADELREAPLIDWEDISKCIYTPNEWDLIKNEIFGGPISLAMAQVADDKIWFLEKFPILRGTMPVEFVQDIDGLAAHHNLKEVGEWLKVQEEFVKNKENLMKVSFLDEMNDYYIARTPEAFDFFKNYLHFCNEFEDRYYLENWGMI